MQETKEGAEMSKTTDYMDEVKRRKGLKSNYQLHKALDVSEQAISECYAGRKHADLYIGTKLALALGIEPIHLLAEVRAEAEKNEKKRNFWLSFLTHDAVVFVCLVVLIAGFGYPSAANASTASTTAKCDGVLPNYKLCAALARPLAALGRWLCAIFGTSIFRVAAPA